MSRLVVLIGSSGVGKSTLARALQEELLPEQWLHFSVDTIFYCLPKSVTLRVDQDNDRSLIQPGSVVASALACTKTLLSEGHRVIYDAVVASDKGASRLLSALDGHNPILVELTLCLGRDRTPDTRSRRPNTRRGRTWVPERTRAPGGSP